MVRISWRVPDSWGSMKRVLILSAPSRSSRRGETTTKRVVLWLLWLMPRARMFSP